MVLLLMS